MNQLTILLHPIFAVFYAVQKLFVVLYGLIWLLLLLLYTIIITLLFFVSLVTVKIVIKNKYNNNNKGEILDNKIIYKRI